MFNQVDRYIARQTTVPILTVMVGAIVLLLLENMYRLFSLTLVEGQPLPVVWKMLGSLIPEYLALGIPLSLLIGVMLAFRRLALASELDALQAVGISYLRLLKVPLLLSVAMVALTYVTVGYVEPFAEYGLQHLLFEVRSGQFGFSVKVGEFIRLSDDVTLMVRGAGESDGRGAGPMSGVFARVTGEGGHGQTVITAATGEFLRTDDPNVLLLQLHDGQAVQTDSPRETPRVATFARYDVPIHLPEIPDFRGRGGKESELTLPELNRARANLASGADSRLRAAGEFHHRMVLVMLPLLIPFLAVASAVPPKRSSNPLGMILGFCALIVLFKVLDFGATATTLPVAPLLWGAYAAFAALSVTLFHGLNSAAGTQYLNVAYVWSDRLMDIGANLTAARRSWSPKRLVELLGRGAGHRDARYDLR
jgi:lipopolysaccharide export system permease protein